ncbi:MAG TPA: hypothetical protein VIV11_25265, partial [Kofleriaceae bacterium]
IDAGVRAFEAKDYATASTELEAAYNLAPLSKLLFAWAQARRLGGHCDEAIPLYRRYLATKPTDQQIEAATTGMLLCERAQAPAPIARPPVLIRYEVAPWYRDEIGGVLAAGGIASVAAGVTFLVLASHSEDAAAVAPTRPAFLELIDEATFRRRIGWAGVGAGSALLIGGVARYLIHDEHARVEVAATGHSITLQARF